MKRHNGKRFRLAGAAPAVVLLFLQGQSEPAQSDLSEQYHLSPHYQLTSAVDQVIERVQPGTDPFITEKYNQGISARLKELGAGLLKSPRDTSRLSSLLASEFRASPLGSFQESTLDPGPELHVSRVEFRSGPEIGRHAFLTHFASFLDDYDEILLADFHIAAITAQTESVAQTRVRYEILGRARQAWRLEKNGYWKMLWKESPDHGWQVVQWIPLEEVRSHARHPIFVDVSASAFSHNSSFSKQLSQGVDYWRTVLDGALGIDVFGNNGVAVGDVDGDGLDDLYICQPSGLPNRLLRNRGDGTFEDITEISGVAALDASSMALFADIDNDADQDLIVITWKRPLLFLNNGSGRFQLKEGAFRFTGESRGAFTAGSLADFDRDGYLDLYLCAYTYFLGDGAYRLAIPYHDANNGPPNVLFRNQGDGSFVDVTEMSGIDQNNQRWSFACAWGDYNGDGWPDLYVANDFGRNNLYRNNGPVSGHVTFTDAATEAGVEDVGAGMSASWFDYDNDGLLDLYVGNMWSSAGLRVTTQRAFQEEAPVDVLDLYRRHAKGNSLFRNRGDGSFEDVSFPARAEMGRWAWNCNPLDFDNDGWQDLYITNGLVTNSDPHDLSSFFWRQVVSHSPLAETPGRNYEDGWRAINRLIREDGSWAGHERNVFLRNNGQGGFDEISGTAGLNFEQDGRAFAVLDYDQDGDPDILLKSRTAPQIRLLRNDFRGAGASLSVRLLGLGSNRDAIGAAITLKTASTRQTRTLQAGSGFLSQDSKEILFGLGESEKIEEMNIRWPSGLQQSFRQVPINHRIRIEEGKSEFEAEPFRPRNYNSGALAGPFPEGGGAASTATWLYDPFPAPGFTLKDLSGREHRLSDYLDRPVLIHFWATRCSPCRGDLAGFHDRSREIETAGVVLLAVSVNQPEELGTVSSFAAEQKLNFPVLLADRETIGIYNILNRYLFDKHQNLLIPTTLLLDRGGRIVKIYRGQIEVHQILTDLKEIEADSGERLRRALPFAGRFYSPLPGRNYFEFGIHFSEKGFTEAAISAFEQTVEVSPRFVDAHYNLGTLYMESGNLQRARLQLERTLQLQPDYAEAHNNLGILKARSGQLAEAIQYFESALSLRPAYVEAMNNVGHAYLESGRTVEAEESFRKALELSPDFPEALNNMGILKGRQGNLQEARSCFDRALKARSDFAEAINNLAAVYAMLGQHREAENLLQEALARNPASEATYLTLIHLYLESGKREEAGRVLRELLKRNPNHPEALQLGHQLGGGEP